MWWVREDRKEKSRRILSKYHLTNDEIPSDDVELKHEIALRRGGICEVAYE